MNEPEWTIFPEDAERYPGAEYRTEPEGPDGPSKSGWVGWDSERGGLIVDVGPETLIPGEILEKVRAMGLAKG